MRRKESKKMREVSFSFLFRSLFLHSLFLHSLFLLLFRWKKLFSSP